MVRKRGAGRQTLMVIERSLDHGFFDSVPASPKFTEMVRDFPHIVDHMMANKIALRAITLDDVAKAKLVFDAYIKVKAQRWSMDELATRQSKPDLPPNS